MATKNVDEIYLEQLEERREIIEKIQKITLTGRFPDGSKIDEHSLEWLKYLIGDEF